MVGGYLTTYRLLLTEGVGHDNKSDWKWWRQTTVIAIIDNPVLFYGLNRPHLLQADVLIKGQE
ncbi:hypothetical protein AOT31_05965 [Corynebacterium ulcerans]|nr:hypothetical protein AOT31_05965 [Corynebacterium ulcerans]